MGFVVTKHPLEASGKPFNIYCLYKPIWPVGEGCNRRNIVFIDNAGDFPFLIG